MQPRKILIADDDAMLRLDLRTLLETLGHQVIGEADNGETACYLARSLRPDAIILDVLMPGMDGLQAAEVISRERLAPVILLTAYSDAPIVEQANRAGVLAYLTKPFRQQELQPTIEIAISRYRELVALEGALGGVQEQIETSRAIGRATRLLMEKHGLSDQEAYRRLQAQALSMQRSLREIAEAVVLIEETATASPGARRPRAARNSRP